MNVRLLVVLAGLYAYSCPVLAECVLSETSQLEFPHKLNLSEEECKFVEYNGSTVVTISVEYPSMKIVKHRPVNDSLVTFRLVNVSSESFDEDGAIRGMQPVSATDHMQYFQIGRFDYYRFISRDGRPVGVTNGARMFNARHLFGGSVEVRYSYTKTHTNLVETEDFAVEFINKIPGI